MYLKCVCYVIGTNNTDILFYFVLQITLLSRTGIAIKRPKLYFSLPKKKKKIDCVCNLNTGRMKMKQKAVQSNSKGGPLSGP